MVIQILAHLRKMAAGQHARLGDDAARQERQERAGEGVLRGWQLTSRLIILIVGILIIVIVIAMVITY